MRSIEKRLADAESGLEELSKLVDEMAQRMLRIAKNNNELAIRLAQLESPIVVNSVTIH